MVAKATGHSRYDQRADQTGAVADPYREVRDALAVQLAPYPRIGHQVVGQHPQDWPS